MAKYLIYLRDQTFQLLWYTDLKQTVLITNDY